jgi:hypothetical protein
MRASLEGLQPRALISSWFVLVAWLAFRKFCFLIIGLSTPAVLHNHLVLLGFISPAGPAEALRRARCRATASYLLHLCLSAPALLALAVALSAFAVLCTLGRLLYRVLTRRNNAARLPLRPR